MRGAAWAHIKNRRSLGEFKEWLRNEWLTSYPYHYLFLRTGVNRRACVCPLSVP